MKQSSAGAIVGIDIAEFDTETAAKQAVGTRYYEVDAFHNNLVFHIDDPASVDSLVSSWQTDLFVSPIICGISSKGKVAVHTYHYNSQGNDTALFSVVTKEAAKRISLLETSVHDSGESVAEIPNTFILHQNTPNPFNPSTTISFTLPEPGAASLSIYSITGQKIRTLVSGQISGGAHSVVWDGRDERGKAVSSGVYLSRLEAGGKAEARRMLLIR
ncbi:MAG: FlgD immunoglobulin-like domain containing protein [Candidatus Latescibacterota bacterium]